MPEFLPFVGTRYDAAKVKLADVVSPPYDVISPEYREVLYARDPHNVIRLELNHDEDRYDSAARIFAAWKKEGTLKREAAPAFYAYTQIFNAPDGSEVTRTGVIGRLRLTPYYEGEVLPHERTHKAPKVDRFALMERTHTNISPIFGLISDPTFLFDQTLEIAAVNPAIADIDETLPNGELVRHILWRLDDKLAVDRVSKTVAQGKVIIADGHHRYETAVEFHEKHPEIAGDGYIMIFLSNLQSPGAIILPTHRLLHDAPDFNQYRLIERLKENFEIRAIDSREDGIAILGQDVDAITLVEFPDEPKWVLVRDASTSGDQRELPAKRIEQEILKPLVGLPQEALDAKSNILYPHSIKELEEMRGSISWDAAFLVRPVKASEVLSIVEQGGFMPQKTTFFYPKLLTGLVFHEFEAQE